MDKKQKLLFLCVGNTCRSPIAALLAEHFEPKGVEARSAGLAAPRYKEADLGKFPRSALEGIVYPLPEAVQAMTDAYGPEMGATLAGHRAILLTKPLAVWADRIVCVQEGMAHWLPKKWHLGQVEHLAVCDPYGGTVERYCYCIDQLTTQVQALFA